MEMFALNVCSNVQLSVDTFIRSPRAIVAPYGVLWIRLKCTLLLMVSFKDAIVRHHFLSGQNLTDSGADP